MTSKIHQTVFVFAPQKPSQNSVEHVHTVCCRIVLQEPTCIIKNGDHVSLRKRERRERKRKRERERVKRQKGREREVSDIKACLVLKGTYGNVADTTLFTRKAYLFLILCRVALPRITPCFSLTLLPLTHPPYSLSGS